MDIIQLKRGTESSWLELNPVLDAGEVGVIYDSQTPTLVKGFKVGNGVSPFSDLVLFSPGGGGPGGETYTKEEIDRMVENISENISNINVKISDQASPTNLLLSTTEIQQLISAIAPTEDQLKAMNSGITFEKVTLYDQNIARAITSIVEGTENGTIKANNVPVSIHGLKALAFKDTLTKEEIGLGNVNNVGITQEQVDKITENSESIEGLTTRVSSVEGKISDQASSTNKVLSESEVNEKIITMGGRQLSSDSTGSAFETKTDLDNGPYYYDGNQVTPQENDTATVLVDETQENRQTSYIRSTLQWVFKAIIGTSFSPSQQLAIDSGITQSIRADLQNKTATSALHILNTGNPHGVTKSQVGLENVDNTSDVNKPISIAQAAKNTSFETSISAAQSRADAAFELASGKTTSYAFDSYTDMTVELSNAPATKYRIGDELYIRDNNTPDYWVSSVNETRGAYGYYSILELEGKIDLTDYQKKTDQSLSTTSKQVVGAINEVKIVANDANITISTHINRNDNPHSVTASQIGAYTKSEVEGLVSGKADKPSTGTPDNFVSLDGNYNIKDSGKSASDFATAAQGAKADTAMQPSNTVTGVSEGSTNGTIKYTKNGSDYPVQVHGLGSAAFSDTSSFATSTQGEKADTALQASDITTGTGQEDGTIKVKSTNIPVKGFSTLKQKVDNLQQLGNFVGSYSSYSNLPINISEIQERYGVTATINDFATVQKGPYPRAVHWENGGSAFISENNQFTDSTLSPAIIYTISNTTVSWVESGVTKTATIFNNSFTGASSRVYDLIIIVDSAVTCFSIISISSLGEITWVYEYTQGTDVSGKIDKVVGPSGVIPLFGEDGGLVREIEGKSYTPNSFATSTQGEKADTAYQIGNVKLYKHLATGDERWSDLVPVTLSSLIDQQEGYSITIPGEGGHEMGKIKEGFWQPRVKVSRVVNRYSGDPQTASYLLEEFYGKVEIDSSNGNVKIWIPAFKSYSDEYTPLEPGIVDGYIIAIF